VAEDKIRVASTGRERMSGKIRIVLSDDHPIVLTGLEKIIESQADFEIVGKAETGPLALKIIREKSPDVAIVDISLPELSGIVLARRLATENSLVRTIILTAHEDRFYLNQAIEAGARGYVLKKTVVGNLISAIRVVMAGGLFVDPSISDQLFNSERRRRQQLAGKPAETELSDREIEVLKLTARGHTSKEIARRLDIGLKSVETYKARATNKLGLKTRAEIVRYASQREWL
jgi:DNA-binding NarL/FixJ family response regulator